MSTSTKTWTGSLKNRSTLTVMLALMTTACAQLPTQSVQPQANLRQKCPPLVAPSDGAKDTILRWMVDTVKLYNDCADKVEKLND